MISTLQMITSQVESYTLAIKEMGMGNYLISKLQERVPFKSSSDYQNRHRTFQKRIKHLKSIRHKFDTQLKYAPSTNTQQNILNVSQSILALSFELNYMERQESLQNLLKLTTPCNLFIPGVGDTLRLLAYVLKMFNALDYYAKLHSSQEIERVVKDIMITGILTLASRLVYDKMSSLKQYLSFSSFRSLISHL